MASTKGVAQEPEGSPVVTTVPARLQLFGHDPSVATLDLIPRSLRWRLARTGIGVGVFVIILPIVAMIPPHAPWAAGAILGAVVVGRGRWSERFTIVGFEAPCPRCGEVLSISKETRLREPHPVSCEGCNHELVLKASLPRDD